MLKMILKNSRILIGLLLLLAGAGCYEVDQEIIFASQAVAIYGLPGDYTSASYQTNIAAVPNSNDYRFREVNKEGKASTGYLRALLLKDNIYIIQAKYDDDSYYYLMFYRFTIDGSGKHYMPLEPADFSQVDKMAPQYGVTVDMDDWSLNDTLTGKRENILNFLYAHKNLNLVQPPPSNP